MAAVSESLSAPTASEIGFASKQLRISVDKASSALDSIEKIWERMSRRLGQKGRLYMVINPDEKTAFINFRKNPLEQKTIYSFSIECDASKEDPHATITFTDLSNTALLSRNRFKYIMYKMYEELRKIYEIPALRRSGT